MTHEITKMEYVSLFLIESKEKVNHQEGPK